MSDNIRVYFDEVAHETDEAFKIDIDGSFVWLPKSLVTDMDEQRGKCRVPEWFAIREGLV